MVAHFAWKERWLKAEIYTEKKGVYAVANDLL